MAAAVRAALYLRVSTGRQADNDLSIPDQRRGGFWRAQFCTEVARPTRFELVTSAFGELSTPRKAACLWDFSSRIVAKTP